MNKLSWLLKADHVHPNDLGHQVIANRIFEVLAQNINLANIRSLEFLQNKSGGQTAPYPCLS